MFNIEFDYRFAPAGVFDAAAKERLETAASIWESVLNDDFANLPAGSTVRVRNPQTDQFEDVVLDRELDDLLIFVGARPLDRAAAFAGPVDSSSVGTNNFEPRTGFITFDSEFSGFANVGLNVHEIGHILGIGTNQVSSSFITDGSFDGATARAVNNGNPIPMSSDGGHIAGGVTLSDQLTPVDGPGIGDGLPTTLDLAILADVGYDVPVLQSASGPVVINYQYNGTSGDDFIQGLNGDDLLLGRADDDTLYGDQGIVPANRGRDTLIGGRGDDDLRGGEGRDRFVFGLASGEDRIQDFTVADDIIQLRPELGITSPSDALAAVTQTGTGTFGGVPAIFSELSLGDQGRVRIFHDAALTESNFLITDETPGLTTEHHDLNRDGNADLLWRDRSNGTTLAWLMDGDVSVGSAPIATVPTNWELVGAEDFDRDNEVDLLWRDSATGDTVIWLMDGNTYRDNIFLGQVSSEWQLVDAADFNGDGEIDLFWRDGSNGNAVFWYMNQGRFQGSAFLGAVALEWQAVGAADMNGDDHPDLLWRNGRDGEVVVWQMEDDRLASGISLGNVASNWELVGASDLTGDRNPDLLWRESTSGGALMWTMQGTVVQGGTSLGSVSSQWQLVG